MRTSEQWLADPWHPSKLSGGELREALAFQHADGHHTWGEGKCGHTARACKTCAACLQAEIQRRTTTGGQQGE